MSRGGRRARRPQPRVRGLRLALWLAAVQCAWSMALLSGAAAQTPPNCEPLPAGSAVVREVALLVDGSLSISDEDWVLERNALTALLDDEGLVSRDGGLALAVLQYSSFGGEPLVRVEQCLTQISSEEDVDAIKAVIAGMRQIRNQTSGGAAILEGAAHLAAFGVGDAAEQRLCLLTDGSSNRGPSVFDASQFVRFEADQTVERLSVAAFADSQFDEIAAIEAFDSAVYGDGQLVFATNTPEILVLAGENCLADPVALRALEVNQSVQTWDDEVPLIAGKATIVRAFLQPGGPVACSVDADATATATGRLEVFREGVRMGAPLLPTGSLRGRFDCRPGEARDFAESSLNFRIPPDWLAVPEGQVSTDVTFYLEMPNGVDCGDGLVSERCEKTLTFEKIDFPSVVWVGLPARPVDVGATPPTLLPVVELEDPDIEEQIRRAQAMLPVGEIDASIESYAPKGAAFAVPTEPGGGVALPLERLDSAVLTELLLYYLRTQCESDSSPTCTQTRIHGLAAGGAGIEGKAAGFDFGLPVSVSSVGKAKAPNAAGYHRNTASHELLHNFGMQHPGEASLFGTQIRDGAEYVNGACGSLSVPGTAFPDFALFSDRVGELGAGDNGERPTLGPLLFSALRDSDVEGWGVDTHIADWDAFQALAIANPNGDWPVMSYCKVDPPVDGANESRNQQWISLDTYQATIDFLRGRDFTQVFPFPALEQQKKVLLKGAVRPNDPTTNAVLEPVYVMESASFEDRPGDYTAELVGADGSTLASRSFTLIEIDPSVADAARPDPDGPPVLEPDAVPFLVALPEPSDDVAEVVIRRGGDELLRVAASANAPTVAAVAPAAASTQSSDEVVFTWVADDADGDALFHALDYSHDDGATWVPLALDLETPRFELPRGRLRAGEEARFRVTTSDGVRSTTVTSEAFSIANNPPVALIQSPEADSRFAASQALGLDVDAFDREDGRVPPDQILWWSSRDGDLGSGPRLDVRANELSVGRHLIAARVFDADGATSSDAVEIEITRLPEPKVESPDFSMRLDPPSAAINPGESAEFTVFVTGLNGFSRDVTLSAIDLPEGWTARFSRSTVRVGATSTLVVTAPPSAPEEPVPVVVQGVSGDLVRVTSGTANLVFGLIPECFGRIAGVVRDAYTGAALEGVRVSTTGFDTTTDAAGLFELLDVDVRRYSVRFNQAGYYSLALGADVRCDDVANLDAAMVPIETGTMVGRVFVGVADPDDTSASRAVTPTDEPIEGATVDVGGARGETGADGAYTVVGIGLSQGTNGPVDYFARAFRDDLYWPASTSVNITREGTAMLDFALVEKCEFIVEASGTVLYPDGTPAVGAQVNWRTTSDTQRVPVGGDGSFTLPRSVLQPGTNNSQRTADLFVTPPPGRQTFRVTIENEPLADRCGENTFEPIRITLELRPLPPVDNFATVSGFVRDAETGEPVRTDVRVARERGTTLASQRTQGDGSFSLQILVGTGEDRSEVVFVEAEESGAHWGVIGETFEVLADETVEVDLSVQAVDFINVEGIVRDRETGEALPEMFVRVENDRDGRITVLSDENGFYRLERVSPGVDNTPTSFVIQGLESSIFEGDVERRYYGESFTRFAEPGQTIVQDFDRLLRCEGGAVSGVVVNAETLEPLEAATLRVSGSSQRVDTDVDGRFRLEKILPGFSNSPRQVEITASKTGFISASKTVTIFCGAEIFVEFGSPPGGFGEVVGTVTDERTGEPIEGVFVGSGWGGSATTDALGAYSLGEAPLTPEGQPRTWLVTASRDGDERSAEVEVSAAGPVRQDFSFSSEVALGFGIGDERTTLDPLTRTLTSTSRLTVTNTREQDLVGPLAATILIDRLGVAMPDVAAADAAGRPVVFVLEAGSVLAPGEAASVELVFEREAPLAFLYDVQLTEGDPTDPVPAPALAAIGVIPPEADADGDRWHDALDVCPFVPDAGQWDHDGDGVGDACETDVEPRRDAAPPIARAGWVALSGAAPAGATRVTLGDETRPVDSEGRFEIRAAVPGGGAPFDLIFGDADGEILRAPVDVEVTQRGADQP